MFSYYRIMPVDRSKIRSRAALHPDLFSDPESFVRKHNLQVRTMKASRGCRGGRPSSILTLDVLTYKGIKVKAVKFSDAPLADLTIDFNPGKCLYGHNGRILSLSDFIDALALLMNHLSPLLADPDDAVDLVPGLRPSGPAYWSYLEIPFQCNDPEGKLLAQLRHLRHPDIRSSSRHWPDSILVGGHRSKVQLSIYRKAVEMETRKKLHKTRLDDAGGILRLELRLKDEKLVQHLGNERNTEEIDGKLRLVRFFPQELVHGHRKAFRQLQGVYAPAMDTTEPRPRSSLVALGRLIAQVSLDPRTAQSFHELLALHRYFTGASASTIKDIRDAGLAELSRMSRISSDTLFSDTAYETQFGIGSEEPERKIYHELNDTIAHRSIYAAYWPREQPFHPHVEISPYHVPPKPEDEPEDRDLSATPSNARTYDSPSSKPVFPSPAYPRAEDFHLDQTPS